MPIACGIDPGTRHLALTIGDTSTGVTTTTLVDLHKYLANSTKKVNLRNASEVVLAFLRHFHVEFQNVHVFRIEPLYHQRGNKTVVHVTGLLFACLTIKYPTSKVQWSDPKDVRAGFDITVTKKDHPRKEALKLYQTRKDLSEEAVRVILHDPNDMKKLKDTFKEGSSFLRDPCDSLLHFTHYARTLNRGTTNKKRKQANIVTEETPVFPVLKKIRVKVTDV